MNIGSVISHSDEYEWEYLHGEEGQEGAIRWKTLISGDKTPSEEITMGIFEVPPGKHLGTHHHAPPEAYFVYEGTGNVVVDNREHTVNAGSVVYVPGNAVHGINNSGSTTLKLVWMFPVSVWRDIVYHMTKKRT